MYGLAISHGTMLLYLLWNELIDWTLPRTGAHAPLAW